MSQWVGERRWTKNKAHLADSGPVSSGRFLQQQSGCGAQASTMVPRSTTQPHSAHSISIRPTLHMGVTSPNVDFHGWLPSSPGKHRFSHCDIDTFENPPLRRALVRSGRVHRSCPTANWGPMEEPPPARRQVSRLVRVSWPRRRALKLQPFCSHTT